MGHKESGFMVKNCETAYQLDKKTKWTMPKQKHLLLSQRKKYLRLILATMMGTISVYSLKMNYQPKESLPVVIEEDYDSSDQPIFAQIGSEDIYIVKNVASIIEEDAINIIDLRDSQDDVKIAASYKIRDPEIQAQIIELILEYNRQYPSTTPWVRSKESLQNEWMVHNLAYQMHFQVSSSRDVDFRSDEEKVYRFFR